MKLNIKNMVCNRCIQAVQQVFAKENIALKSLQLGEAETIENLNKDQLLELQQKLRSAGFEILDDAESKSVSQIKSLIVQKIAQLDIPENFILSEYLSSAIHRNYSALSKLFSRNTGITLEQYFILQKVEKIKELLSYNEYSLTEISAMLGYKSVQHISSQFKNITGFTPTEFKKLKVNLRQPLDNF